MPAGKERLDKVTLLSEPSDLHVDAGALQQRVEPLHREPAQLLAAAQNSDTRIAEYLHLQLRPLRASLYLDTKVSGHVAQLSSCEALELLQAVPELATWGCKVQLADRAAGVAMQPIGEASLVENVQARSPAAEFAGLQLLKANRTMPASVGEAFAELEGRRR